jgi:hypothetical protein
MNDGDLQLLLESIWYEDLQFMVQPIYLYLNFGSFYSTEDLCVDDNVRLRSSLELHCSRLID